MAVNNGNKSTGVSVNWEVEVFAFKNPHPSLVEDPEEAKGNAMFSLTSTPGGFSLPPLSFPNPTIDPITQLENTITNVSATQSDFSVNVGINNISFNRSKDACDGAATFTVVGPAHSFLIPGSWVVINARDSLTSDSPKIVKFIGQIASMSVDYMAQENGNVTTYSTFQVREWSSCLTMAVKFDLNSLHASNRENAGSDNQLPDLGSIAQKYLGNADTTELFSKPYNPFEFAHLVLKLIGAINESDQLNNIQELGDLGFDELALRMPSIPSALLSRLGVDASFSSTGNIFKSGLVKTITGIQKEPVYADGDWNGVFSETTISEYAELLDKNPPDRPFNSGISVLASMNLSAWALLQQFTDPSLNEIFTDFYYEQRNGKTVSQPVIVIRDKPFILKTLITKGVIPYPLNIDDTYTLYDNIPRVAIDNVYIKNLQVRNTILNSPNYILVAWQSGIADKAAIKQQVRAQKPLKLDAEMRRYGGQEASIETQFLGVDPAGVNVTNPLNIAGNGNLPQHVEKVRQFIKAAYAYDYRFLHGTLTIKDDNLPISLGMNVQFDFGEYTLVGHVNSISTVHAINQNGGKITETKLQVSRIVQVNEQGELDFIPPEHFAQLTQATPQDPPDIAKDNSFLGNIAEAIINFLSSLF